ncbi:MAG: helix-turn-helix transcriptional regulator [Tepidisphaeraceae bacterium]
MLRTIRDCAFAIGRRPSSNVFISWTRHQRRRRRRTRRDAHQHLALHIASIDNVYAHFPGWAEALEAARITDDELRAARSKWTTGLREPEPPDPSALELLEALTPKSLEAIGLQPVERDRLLRGGARAVSRLPYSRGCSLANALDGSLQWLVGRDALQGDPPDIGETFDGTDFVRRRQETGVREDALVRRAGIPLGRYRRIVRGTEEPTLDEARRLERALQRGAP